MTAEGGSVYMMKTEKQRTANRVLRYTIRIKYAQKRSLYQI